MLRIAYGITLPHCEGKVGMVSFYLDADLLSNPPIDFSLLNEHFSFLPSYARPVFLRFRLREHIKTSTLKCRKRYYADQGYHPSKTEGDLIYVQIPPGQDWMLVDDLICSSLDQGLYRF